MGWADAPAAVFMQTGATEAFGRHIGADGTEEKRREQKSGPPR